MEDNHIPKPWYTQSIDEVYKALNTSEDGLSDAEALIRLQKYGKNELRATKKRGIFKMLWEQLTDAMVLILIAAAGLSAVLGHWAECIVIMFIVAINALISIIQEKKAANALEALRQMSAPMARVMREGEESVVPSSEIVLGDVVFLEDGSIVPADIRLIDCANLKIQEASLTGESVPVDKDVDVSFDKEVSLGDRVNMAYTSSIVMYGNGFGVAVGTGMNTEVGHIANLLEEQDDFDTPLKRKLNAVGKTLSLVGIAVCLIIFAVGFMYGRPLIPLLMTAISLAISVIPEGLPATATIVMALGVQRMARKNALVRRLPAVETLGSATVICSDKTGTLTQNKMTVTQLAVNDDFKNKVTSTVEESVKKNPDRFKDLIYAGALCNKACLNPDAVGEILGDPTEGALIFLAQKFGIEQEEFEDKYPQKFEQPFDSDRKRMTTVHEIEGEIVSYTKGAVDEMLEFCSYIQTDSGVREMTDQDRDEILESCLKLSEQALRVLGFAKRKLDVMPQDDDENVEVDMIFLGIVGMIDPPRKEVIEAIKVCHQAGIRVIMITGDHKVTAMAIAKQLGIFQEGNTVVAGDEFDAMTEAELNEAVKTTTVFARVSPKEKLAIINALKVDNEVPAMTGDGVNDSPALKAADIGIAMGKSGTDVAKDASDMILLDDNFTTIEFAIREGRRVYRNIQKVIQFLLAGNIAEIMVLFVATMLDWDAPILAVHILLINLATDTLPALALGVDPVSKNIMKHKPVKSGSLFEKSLVTRVFLHGAFIAIATLCAYWYGLETTSGGHDVAYPVAMTMAFLVLAISQLFHALNQRSNTQSVFSNQGEMNWYLFFAMFASGVILAVIVCVPALEQLFSLVMLNAKQWQMVMLFSLIPLAFVEVSKFYLRISKKVKSKKV